MTEEYGASGPSSAGGGLGTAPAPPPVGHEHAQAPPAPSDTQAGACSACCPTCACPGPPHCPAFAVRNPCSAPRRPGAASTPAEPTHAASHPPGPSELPQSEAPEAQGHDNQGPLVAAPLDEGEPLDTRTGDDAQPPRVTAKRSARAPPAEKSQAAKPARKRQAKCV